MSGVLAEPALALTDLALGIVGVGSAYRVRGRPGIQRTWVRTFGWTGAAALAGFVHHGLVAFSDRLTDVSFAIVTMMVVVGVSYLLAATVAEVLGPGRRRVFWILRLMSLGGYLALALAGRAGASSILLAESVTMVLILALWIRGLRAHHPLAVRVIVAFVVSALAALPQALSPSVRLVGLDPTSLYHLAQIPGLLLLARALLLANPTDVHRAGELGKVPVARTSRSA
ncbi:MAG: hypothetical protein JWM12_1866 [Ilumatobacteraceae bacterium]|nr:hypothetical protein [Ilumatobacteraceae bacterium]